jgi:hypothetical protein
MTPEEKRARYVEELIFGLKTALECAEIVQKDPSNRTALRTLDRHIKMSAAIHQDIVKTAEADR